MASYQNQHHTEQHHTDQHHTEQHHTALLCCLWLKTFRDSRDSSDTENEDFLQVPIVNYQEFSTIDNNLECYNEIDDSDDEDPPVPVTNQEAKKFIAALQHYFMQVGNDESPTSTLNTCADFVQLQSYKNITETTLDAFLQK